MLASKKRQPGLAQLLGVSSPFDRDVMPKEPRGHHARPNSAISPISVFSSAPTLYATLHLSLMDSTFLLLSPACQTSIDCVIPRLCFASNDRPVWGFS